MLDSTSQQKSPFRSPTKQRMEVIGTVNASRFSFSPVKTPNGRAGLLSPEKRSINDLDKSARKRAKNSIYNRIMDEYLHTDDYLNEKDRILADRIIKQSRGEQDYVNYGSDVELEIDLTQQRRTRRRVKQVAYSTDSGDDYQDTEDPSSEEEEEDNDNGDGEVEFVFRPSVERSSKLSNSPPKAKPKNSIVRRAKRGRPSKSELVLGQIKSIFHQDDELFSTDRKTFTPSKQTQAKKPTKNYLTSIFDQNFDRSTVPTLSGIPKSKSTHQEKETFEPLPIPNLDSDGNIADKEYILKYFDGIDPAKFKEGRFMDEKVFFLEGPEGYFEQQTTRLKHSGNSLTALAPQIDYSDFAKLVKLGDNLSFQHKRDLFELHKFVYHQWCFEMSQGFNLNFYGVGSKIDILKDFALNYFGIWWKDMIDADLPKILVVNGFNPSINIKKLILEIASILLPDELYPKHIAGTVPFVVDFLNNHRLPCGSIGFHHPKILLIIHNLDGEVFRVDKTQTLLSQLMALPEVWAMSSTDHINASLLWDLSKLKNLNFIWHNLTTYSTYQRETSFRDVISLGKSKKFVGGLGAKFVLRSLTDNHRNLYRELLIAQLDNMEKLVPSASGRMGMKGNIKVAVELKNLYNTCLDEFITSNEMNFRTFLKEYIEHKMCQLVKDSSGVEMIFIPFTYEEIQNIYKQEFDV